MTSNHAKTGGFDPSYFKHLAEIEPRSFWFRSRNQVILWALKKFFLNDQKFLEMGCGTGYVLRGISKAFPAWDLCGSEVCAEGLRFAADRLPGIRLIRMDARSSPFESEFDVIGAFDVLEHIEEDEAALKGIYRALRVGGGALMTVPQHPFLWSSFDDFSHHVRRYRSADLRAKLEKTGFRIILMTSFVSLLMPALLWSRRNRNQPVRSAEEELSTLSQPGWADVLLEGIMTVERLLIQRGIRFPFGGSLLVVVKKDKMV